MVLVSTASELTVVAVFTAVTTVVLYTAVYSGNPVKKAL